MQPSRGHTIFNMISRGDSYVMASAWSAAADAAPPSAGAAAAAAGAAAGPDADAVTVSIETVVQDAVYCLLPLPLLPEERTPTALLWSMWRFLR